MKRGWFARFTFALATTAIMVYGFGVDVFNWPLLSGKQAIGYGIYVLGFAMISIYYGWLEPDVRKELNK